eukprot:6562953-Prorocentrum_lima.AAC.1
MRKSIEQDQELKEKGDNFFRPCTFGRLDETYVVKTLSGVLAKDMAFMGRVKGNDGDSLKHLFSFLYNI